MSKNHQIIWEKWYSPFGEDDEQNDENLAEDIDELIDEESDVEEQEEKSIIMHKNLYRQKFMITPLGVMPLTENTESGKIFNFWTGHTNFNISSSVAHIIENCDGVETFDVFTRYRFRIAIGKIFKESDVMFTINDRVYSSL